MNELLNIFPFIEQTKAELEKQNKFLNKVTLTGKINALEAAANLFEFTDKTIVIFDELIDELIDALLQENLEKVKSELNFKSKTAIDILIRNLFERTADVGFLATDSTIVEFLLHDTISKDTMKERLIEYTKKYSVYNEIIILDADANVKVNIHTSNNPITSHDSLVKDALDSDDYIEVYKYSDLFKSQEKTLIYAQKIVHNNQAIGVLCLCFKFEDELSSMFSQLSSSNETIILADKHGPIYSNTPHSVTYKYEESDYKILGKTISTMNKTTGYQGYSGIDDWYSIAQSSTTSSKAMQTSQENKKINISLLDNNLMAIIEKANDLIDDISDVIINGELIAAKRKVYVLTPILNNLREISESLLRTIKSSVENLEEVTYNAIIHDAKMTSNLAIDIMDRNLYERANDCRWWALTPIFEEELAQEVPNKDILEKTLLYINNLYTVYTNIFLYDSKAKIIAASHDSSICGKQLHAQYVEKTLHNTNTQDYFVSKFETSPYYNEKATYIYSASIQCNNNTTAGIGIVFDSEVEFKAILDDSFPKNRKGFLVFTDQNKKIISSTSRALKVLDTLDIDDKYFTKALKHSINDFIQFNEKNIS